MKTHKIIISTLALAMGAALAGSVSGTVAWFQYSTRAQASFVGTSAHCSEALEAQAVSVGGDAVEANWKTELTYSDIATAYGATSAKLVPITSGAMAKNGALPKVVTTPDDPDTAEDETDYGNDPAFYANPIYQHFDLNTWDKAVAANYAQFDLLFRVKDIDGQSTASYLAKNVYLTNLSIVSLKAKDGGGYETDNGDLYKAIRVHLSGSSNFLFANDGTTTNEEVTTAVSSTLDLNNDGKFDAPSYYDWEDATTAQAYGDSGNQVAYNIGKFAFTDDSDPTIPSAKQGSGLIGATTSSEILRVTVTIWIEGWQQLGTPLAVPSGVTDSANDAQVWDPATYIGKNFGVGFRFAVPAHNSVSE